MTKEALEDCRQKLREINEQEEKLSSFQRKAHRLAEETFYEIQSIVKKNAETNEPLQLARQELGKLEAGFLEEITYEKRKLTRQRQDYENLYRKLKLQLDDE
ncbi:MAG: hypothetical protein IC227_05770 [Enterococcus lacertideformus]|uniref:Uncharacterized protein n=1 Tax=Enterococcus lacertideformus TaxID=2771493 RepID=A0A931FBS8_9ENTE|nr:hypothetical protein [Enterococcus lacertideformus]